MENIKIICLDIDGTIRNSKGIIEEPTKIAIKKCRDLGIIIVLCTGRSYKYAKRVASEIENEDFIISSNGAEVVSIKDDYAIYENTIDRKSVEDLYEYCKKYQLNFLLNTIKEDYQTIEESYNRKTITNLDDIKDSINQIVITSYNKKAMFNVANEFMKKTFNLNITSYSPNLTNPELPLTKDYYFDINNCNSSKANGIKILLEYLKLNFDSILAIGDGLNDLEMIKEAGVGVAMGNGEQKLKDNADIITDTNDDYGVVNILNKIIELHEKTH